MTKKLIKLFVAAFAAASAMACGSSLPSEVGVRTDALDDAAWNESIWISAADAPVVTGAVRDPNNNRAADGAGWFVSTMKNEQKVISARWMTTGLGVYQLYVNGRPVGREVLKPGFTHYAKTKRSFTYDLTDAIVTKAGGENTYSAQVTPGWWADKIVTPSGHDGMVGKKCAFRAVLELTFADGRVKRYGTDLENWKAGIAGPVKHAAIFDGEEYDARELPGYATPEKLSVPEANTEFAGEILPSDGAEIYFRPDLTLSPVQAYVWEGVEGESEEEYGKVRIVREFTPGEVMTVLPEETLVVDFGQNCSAVPSFVFQAKEGTKLTCLPGELLNDGNGAKSRGMDGPEGSVHRLNLRTPEQGMRVCYTFADAKGDVSYHPTCSFFGYRYVSITATDEVRIRSISSLPVTSIDKEMETGVVATGNEQVNRLISNTLWGQRSNYLSVPTDCPQRNERLGWTADTQVFAETGTFFADTKKFFHKWMRDMRDTQSEFGGFPGVAPIGQYGAEPTSMMRLGWADAGVIVPWTVWKQFGDTEIIEENWDAMERFMDHINATKYDHETLSAENGNYQWADWLSYEPLESSGGSAFTSDASGKRIPLPEAIVYWNYLSASYWAIDAGMMRDMAAATGRAAGKYETMVSEAKAYLKNTFLDGKGAFKTAILNTMQTPALFALENCLVEGEAKAALTARLRENFAQHGNCLQTGFLGTSILMNTLTENGMADLAWELLFQRKNPSWLYSVDNGATTIWERWNSYMLDKGMGPRGMNSFNHYAYGCVCEWIWKTVCGIAADTAAPGFKRIIMKPVPDKRLGFVKAAYDSAAGRIESEWKYEGDKWIWNFTIPEGATASVTLPGETEAKEYAAGSYTVEQ
jgi:alpha-L-rhamnosidase